MQQQIELAPYYWSGPYAEWRDDAPHDPGLCFTVRAPWMAADERLIIRSSEVVGYPEGFLYDDHYPVSDPEGRGKEYRHHSFTWDPQTSDDRMTAICVVPGKGRFTLDLRARADFVDITLSVRNDLAFDMGPVDWAMCAIALECPTLRNPEHDHTFLVQSGELHSLRELGGDSKMRLYNVEGTDGFVPVGHKMLEPGPVRAEASVVVIESESKRYSTALAFDRSYSIYSCRGNMCFHADPWFGTLRPGEEKVVRGRLYLMEGDAEQALQRYRNEFPLQA